MAGIPKIVLPHGGYKKLIVYRKSDVVYEGVARVTELRQKIDRTAWSMRRKKGWG